MAHHGNPIEMVESAVQVVDLTMAALDLRRHKVANEKASEVHSKLEEELKQQQEENERLRLEVEQCHRSLLELQKSSVEGRCMASHSLDCPKDLCEQVKKVVESPLFVEKIKNIQPSNKTSENGLQEFHCEDMMVNVNPEDPNWWLWITNDCLNEPKEEADCLNSDGYVIVSQDDVVESIAVFVAKCIALHPASKCMTPKELQESIAKSLSKIESKGMMKKLWDVSKFMYIAASWSTAAVGLYKNPFVVRLILKALSTTCKLIIRLLA